MNSPGFATSRSVSVPYRRRSLFCLISLPVLGGFVLCVAGCRSEMYDQARYEPMEQSEFFNDGTSARGLVAGTVPQPDRSSLAGVNEPAVLLGGLDRGRPATALPFPLDRQVLKRGQDRYRVFCTPCHGELGDGQGMIVKRGFTPPPSFADERLRNEPLGHFFEVISRGHGVMYSYASRVPPRDRWAISSYIRALQLSQHALASELPADDQAQLKEVTP
jgi:hypothetical protein